MTTTDNLTAQIEPKTTRKKYGKMEFSAPPKKEQVKEVDLKNDEKFQEQLKTAKSYFDDVNLEASSAKQLKNVENIVNQIAFGFAPIIKKMNADPNLKETLDEMLPTLSLLNFLRKEMFK
jgi:hypothetical protein